MRKNSSIRLFLIVCVALFLGIVLLVYSLNTQRQHLQSQQFAAEKAQKLAAEKAQQLAEGESAESATILSPYQYILREEDGYVMVYASDGETLFEATGIWFPSLTKELQEEIEVGKPIYSEEELYSFLENYSS
ncbi:hypothetical protein FACS1894111_11330 [Clostridia bacterium]|nr:hypothetical protein FACS1894111_11330 [Clostridia bacterium]